MASDYSNCDHEWDAEDSPLAHICGLVAGHDGPHKCGYVNCGSIKQQSEVLATGEKGEK